VSPEAKEPIKAAVHEFTHLILGHTRTMFGDIETMEQRRRQREFAAESTAYLVMKELNQLTEDSATESITYITDWLGEDQPTDRDIRSIFLATNDILNAGHTRPQFGAGWSTFMRGTDLEWLL
jgi:hypothetical protein